MRFRKPMIVVLFIASISSLYLGFANISLRFDKFVHFAVFFMMTLIFYYCFDTKNNGKLRLVTFFVCTMGAGIGSEFLQSVLPYRTFDYGDILMNVVGSSAGLVTCDLYNRYVVRRRRLRRLEIIKSLGDEAENLAESQSRASYSEYSDSSRNSMSVYGESGNSDVFNSDIEAQLGAFEGEEDGGDSGRERRGTMSIELKNVAPISLN